MTVLSLFVLSLGVGLTLAYLSPSSLTGVDLLVCLFAGFALVFGACGVIQHP